MTVPERRPARGLNEARTGWFWRAIEAFVPAIHELGAERLERASLVAGVCVTIAVVTLPLVAVSCWVYGGVNVTSLSGLGVSAAMLGIGFFQRRTGRVELAAALVPAVLLVVLVAVGFRRGGLGAVNLMCYPFVPLVAGFVVGRRGAVFSALGVTAVMIGFGVLHSSGYVFPAGYAGNQRSLIAALGVVLLSALVMGITLLYEDTRTRARRATAESLAELRRRGVELEEARERSEAAARAKGEFLARVSHELRTPLNGVLGMTELLLGSGLSAEQRDFARDSRRSAKALLALVNELLDFSKLESGTVELHRTGLDPRTPAEDTVGVLAGAAQRKGLELVCHVEPDVPRWVLSDADRVRQVLLNLVGNGIKYTDSGRVVLRVRRPRPRGPLRFEVVDTGVGLPPGETARLFEPFSQADPEANRRLGGVGLGLAICHQLVRRMGGRIGAKRTPQGGSCFWFTLPVHSPEAPEPPALSLPISGRSVVVVDDDAAAAEAVAATLRGHGAAVSTFTRVVDAVEALRSAPADLVIVDTVMPDRDALSLLRELSQDASLRRLPVLLSVPYGLSIDLSDLGGMRTGRVRKPILEAPLLGSCAALLGLPPPYISPGAEATESGASMPVMDGQGARVLVVDDNDVGRRLAKKLLVRLGFAVEEASDGREAVSKALSTPYAVILMDCRMPELDGYEATRLIREAEASGRHRSSIVAVTAHALDDERERCLTAGMDDYLTKPFRPADLARIVLAWVKPASP